MTASPPRPPVTVTDIDDAIELVKRSGMRLTAARRLVLESLLAAQGPLAADELALGVGKLPGTDLASVYRNLETFEALGIVRHFHAGHGAGRYVLEGSSSSEYLACESCGRVDQVATAALDAVRDEIRGATGFRASFSHFPIVGICSTCDSDPVHTHHPHPSRDASHA